MPGTLFAAMHDPIPAPSTTIPHRHAPSATRRATACGEVRVVDRLRAVRPAVVDVEAALPEVGGDALLQRVAAVVGPDGDRGRLPRRPGATGPRRRAPAAARCRGSSRLRDLLLRDDRGDERPHSSSEGEDGAHRGAAGRPARLQLDPVLVPVADEHEPRATRRACRSGVKVSRRISSTGVPGSQPSSSALGASATPGEIVSSAWSSTSPIGSRRQHLVHRAPGRAGPGRTARRARGARRPGATSRRARPRCRRRGTAGAGSGSGPLPRAELGRDVRRRLLHRRTTARGARDEPLARGQLGERGQQRDVPDLRHGDERAEPLDPPDHAARLEVGERLADGRPRHAVPLPDRGLGREPVAGLEATLADLPEQRVLELRVERERGLAVEPGCGRRRCSPGLPPIHPVIRTTVHLPPLSARNDSESRAETGRAPRGARPCTCGGPAATRTAATRAPSAWTRGGPG